jgi:hypothetical protein
VAYFYFDPAAFAINADLSETELSFSPRLFFEDNGLWDVALKLTRRVSQPQTQCAKRATPLAFDDLILFEAL